jgi:hypothetical protein
MLTCLWKSHTHLTHGHLLLGLLATVCINCGVTYPDTLSDILGKDHSSICNVLAFF